MGTYLWLGDDNVLEQLTNMPAGSVKRINALDQERSAVVHRAEQEDYSASIDAYETETKKFERALRAMGDENAFSLHALIEKGLGKVRAWEYIYQRFGKDDSACGHTSDPEVMLRLVEAQRDYYGHGIVLGTPEQVAEANRWHNAMVERVLDFIRAGRITKLWWG